jgi:DNA ligase (NAD+)
VSDNYVENLNVTKEGKLTGKLICITGTLSQDRSYFARLIEDNGGKVASSVTKKTTHLLAGVDCGSKLDKAQSLGLPILTEEEFMAMING